MVSSTSCDPFGLGSTRSLFLRLAGATAGSTGLAASSSAAALAATGPDWADLRALARREHVTTALWPRLRGSLARLDGVALPSEVDEAFRREAMVAEFNARRLEARLHEVLEILGGCDIEPVLLKGAGLAYSVFGGMARRPMHDLDLLVRRAEREPAMTALRAAGWVQPPAGQGQDRYAHHQHSHPLDPPAGGVGVVEIHDALLPPGHPFQVAAGAVMSRSRRIASPVGPVLVPAAADQLLHACLHFTWSHEMRWGAWRAIADVAALVGASAAEDAAPADEAWQPTTRALDEVVDGAIAAGAGSAVYWTLRLAAGLGDVPVPEEWLTGLAQGGWSESALLERHLVHQLLPGPGNSPSVALSRCGWMAAVRPGRSGHGGARPWLVGASRATVGAIAPVDRLAGIGRQLAAPGRWRSYVGALLG